MHSYQITASALVNAPAEQVYAILSDYRNGHPHILPKPYFLSLEVEQGGIGAGTVITFEMRVLGKTQASRATITEPAPGRVLMETNEPSGIVTTFTVDPVGEGRHAQVTITTDMTSRGGPLGLLERFFTRTLLRRIYRRELALLNAFARERAAEK